MHKHASSWREQRTVVPLSEQGDRIPQQNDGQCQVWVGSLERKIRAIGD